jgi:hypothetical protein
MLEPIAAADDPDDLDGFPGRFDRLAEPDAVPALHHARPRGSDAQQEAAVRELLQAERGRRQHRRTARTQLHHKGSQVDRRRLGGDERQPGQRVVTPDLRRPQRIDTEPLGRRGELHCARQPGLDHGSDLHA